MWQFYYYLFITLCFTSSILSLLMGQLYCLNLVQYFYATIKTTLILTAIKVCGLQEADFSLICTPVLLLP